MVGRTPGATVMMALVAAGAWSCLSCSGPSATSPGSTGDGLGAHAHDLATEHQLWHFAQEAAGSMGGSVKNAQAVESRRSVAARVTSGDIVPGDQAVWVIQIEGVHTFVCQDCSRPAGAPPQSGRFLTFSLDARTLQLTDFGIGSSGADLGKLGTVINLDD